MVIEACCGEPGGRELDWIAGNLGLAIMPFDSGHIAPLGRGFVASAGGGIALR